VVRDVEPSILTRLLDLQAEDSAIRLLRHRRDSLPETRRLAELVAQLEELDSDIAIATSQCDDAQRDQTRIEGEIGLADQKIEREEGRLFSGAVANPKELGALQAEVAMLRRNRAAKEDDLLEVMVRRDQADDTLAKLRAERDSVAAEAARVSERVGAETGAIDAEMARRSEVAASVRAELPGDLLALYDTIRESKSGVGAAALVGGACQGCHTQLPARDVERMRSEGGLQRCDNCRRILVVH
jgi:predicted  nucleic acid-binding Zn-ribbon protein